jgi:hypothetical protein
MLLKDDTEAVADPSAAGSARSEAALGKPRALRSLRVAVASSGPSSCACSARSCDPSHGQARGSTLSPVSASKMGGSGSSGSTSRGSSTTGSATGSSTGGGAFLRLAALWGGGGRAWEGWELGLRERVGGDGSRTEFLEVDVVPLGAVLFGEEGAEAGPLFSHQLLVLLHLPLVALVVQAPGPHMECVSSRVDIETDHSRPGLYCVGKGESVEGDVLCTQVQQYLQP